MRRHANKDEKKEKNMIKWEKNKSTKVNGKNLLSIWNGFSKSRENDGVVQVKINNTEDWRQTNSKRREDLIHDEFASWE